MEQEANQEENWGRTPEEVSQVLAVLISDELLQFGLTVSLSEAVLAIDNWLGTAATNTGVSVEEAAAALGDLEPVAQEIVHSTALALGEERPGTDPWKHDANIPMPLPLANVIQAALALTEMLATYNDADTWVRYASQTGVLLNALIEKQTEELDIDEMEIRLSNGNRGFIVAPIIYLPQPAVAYIARLIEVVSTRVQQSRWSVPDDLDDEGIRQAIINLKEQAMSMRELNIRYGVPAGPTRLS